MKIFSSFVSANLLTSSAIATSRLFGNFVDPLLYSRLSLTKAPSKPEAMPEMDTPSSLTPRKLKTPPTLQPIQNADSQQAHQSLPSVDTPADQWFLPKPSRLYRGLINDVDAFREARSARRRQDGVFNEDLEGAIPNARGVVDYIYDAIYQTDSVADGLRDNDKSAIAVLRIREGYWDDDVIWMASWKIFVSVIMT